MKKFLKILIVLAIIILIALVVIFNIYNNNLSAVSKSDEEKIVKIEKGMTSSSISKLLKEENLIKDELSFKIYIKLNKIDNLKYGTYIFKESMSSKEIIEMLIEGSDYNPDEVTLTIKEGINMREIASAIEKVTNNSSEDVINKSNDTEYLNMIKEKYWFITDEIFNDRIYYKLEGYIYPDTYKLTNKDVNVEYIFNKMLDEMSKKLEKYKDNNYNDLSLHQRLTLASIVEKESSVSSDRSKMASVFINRMKKGMNLGSDVTARYANKIDDKKRVLTAKEFQIKSPYNTRLNDGSMNGKLPVGPISTISIESIDAAFNPANEGYLYFISNIETLETFYYESYNDFLNKKNELANINRGF